MDEKLQRELRLASYQLAHDLGVKVRTWATPTGLIVEFVDKQE